MALCHRWDAKNDFAYVLQFFSLISDGLGGVCILDFVTLLVAAKTVTKSHNKYYVNVIILLI